MRDGFCFTNKHHSVPDVIQLLAGVGKSSTFGAVDSMGPFYQPIMINGFGEFMKW